MRNKQVVTSLRPDEIEQVDALQGARWGRAGTLRAMVRFALEHRELFIEWLDRTDERPL